MRLLQSLSMSSLSISCILPGASWPRRVSDPPPDCEMGVAMRLSQFAFRALALSYPLCPPERPYHSKGALQGEIVGYYVRVCKLAPEPAGRQNCCSETVREPIKRANKGVKLAVCGLHQLCIFCLITTCFKRPLSSKHSHANAHTPVPKFTQLGFWLLTPNHDVFFVPLQHLMLKAPISHLLQVEIGIGNLRKGRQNSGECERRSGKCCTVGSPDFTRVRQTSRKGAHMLPVPSGSCPILELFASFSPPTGHPNLCFLRACASIIGREASEMWVGVHVGQAIVCNE